MARMRISGGGKVRVSAGRVSYSNRGGARVGLGGGFSAGKTGVRYSTGSGPFRISAGATGVRGAIVGGSGPFYGGINASGPFIGAAFGGVSYGKKVKVGRFHGSKTNPRKVVAPTTYLTDRPIENAWDAPRALSPLEWWWLCRWDSFTDRVRKIVHLPRKES